MHRYCLALDLINDEQLIKEYEVYHQQVWPEILQSIRQAGIDEMQIYRVGNRLFMIIESARVIDFAAKATADAASEKVQQWENLMWKYQQAFPFAKEGEKWMMMNKIFDLKETENI